MIKREWIKTKQIVGKIHKVSDTLKFPIFDKRIISRLFGMQIAGLAAALSFVVYPTHAFDYNLAQNSQSESLTAIVITTNSEYQFPLEMTLGMSQGYNLLHSGVDLRAPRGTKIFAMAQGTVIEVEAMAVGYGHFVRIAHNGTVSSLYAHLDKVYVVPGQKVDRGQTLGNVGMTGWTTGPHLHFEVYSGNKAVNPMKYISSK
jgi:murein DD-endopeptidase MepM/ murein hydrolase activator NlpD